MIKNKVYLNKHHSLTVSPRIHRKLKSLTPFCFSTISISFTFRRLACFTLLQKVIRKQITPQNWVLLNKLWTVNTLQVSHRRNQEGHYWQMKYIQMLCKCSLVFTSFYYTGRIFNSTTDTVMMEDCPDSNDEIQPTQLQAVCDSMQNICRALADK